MATQQTGTPPNTRRLGIFPDSIRRIVIVVMIVLFVIAGTIGVIGILRGWDTVFNVLFMIFAAASAILAILAFWPSHNQNETYAPASPRQLQLKSKLSLTWGEQAATQDSSESKINNVNHNQTTDENTVINTGTANPQQVPNNIPNTVPPEQPVRGKISQISRDDLLDKLSQCIPATFNKVVFCSGMRESDLPDGDRTTKAIRLIQWAESSGPGLKKIYECYESEIYGKKNLQNQK